MRLVDLFLKIFAATVQFVNQGGGDIGGFRLQIGRLIGDAIEISRKAGVPENDFRDGLFAVVAWVDETIMCSGLAEADRWQKATLQMEHFRTSRAGVEFYERLEQLAAARKQVREVYYLALAAGFRGRYLADNDRAHLDRLKEQQLQMLVDDNGRLVLEGRRPLLASAYAAAVPTPGDGGRGLWLRSLPLTAILLPVAVVGVLYVSFALILSLTVHRILTSLG